MSLSTSARSCRVALRNHKTSPLCQSKRLVSSTQAAHEECDMVIVGGGPVGLALASALGSSQAIRESSRVVLVEAGDLSKVHQWLPSPGTFSNRVSSLTNSSQLFLRDIGAWERVEAERTTPIEQMQVWDGVSDARIKFSASEISLASPEEGMAKLTENLNLQRGLLRRLKDLPSVQLLDKTRVQSIQRDTEGGWPMVHLENGRVLRTRLLVGADGFNSPVRTYAQIPSFGWSYDTQAIVATMIHPPRGAFESPNTTAYQRFLPTGPIAFLPLSPTVSSLVWSTRPHLAAALLASEPAVLTSMINAAFRLPEVSLCYLRNRIVESHAKGTPLRHPEVQEEILWRERSHAIDPHSAYSCAVTDAGANVGVPPADSELLPPLVTSLQAGTVASFPLRFNHTESYIGEGHGSRTVLIGDAAHTVHPLAGQGLNMGLADAECLAMCIEQAILQGGDVGSYTALLPYAQERYIQNHTIMGAIDKLHKLYSTTSEPLVWARSIGVEVLNELDSVKTALMMTAGAQRRTTDRGRAWSLAAKGIETLVTSADAAKAVGGGLSRTLTGILHEILKATTPKENK